MDVDRSAQVAMHHGGALGVPTGTLAPGARPAGFAGLSGLPQGKVERIVLVLVLLDARANHKVVDVAARDLTIVGIAAHGKVHIAVIGCVSVALLDKRLDHGDHGADLLGGAGRTSGSSTLAARMTPINLSENSVATSAPFGLLVGALDDLVIDIGEVLGERDLVAARDEPATNHVKADERAGIADVDVVVDRGAAHVHADLAGLDGLELFLFMGSAVVDTHSLLLNGFL